LKQTLKDITKPMTRVILVALVALTPKTRPGRNGSAMSVVSPQAQFGLSDKAYAAARAHVKKLRNSTAGFGKSSHQTKRCRIDEALIRAEQPISATL